MVKYAVVKTGGKQYLVKENDEIIVDRLADKEGDKINLETLATFEDEGKIDLGTPVLKEKLSATVVGNMKGEKIRIAKFKSKVRYRRMSGFRPSLSKIKISKI
jgi:large subunit ribosomal protein L21